MPELACNSEYPTQARENRPRPLFGLPQSLLKQEGKTLAIFALLQPMGLNRDLKRKLADHDQKPLDGLAEVALGALPSFLPEQDRLLLRRWANPFARIALYWSVMKPRRSGERRLDAYDYGTAIELALLDAFYADWKALRLDEGALMARCPGWPEIRARIKEHMGAEAAKCDFGVFMSWPRILDELAIWEELDNRRRDAVGRAVFALSSISLNDWFAHEAIRLCPDLADEFFFPQDEVGPSDTDEVLGGETTRPGTDWTALVDRLDAVADELRHAPTQRTVAELQTLAEEFGEAASKLPSGTLSDSERLTEKVTLLLEDCRRLAQEPAFSWLDTNLLEQLDARWRLALTRMGDDATALLEDADASRGRVDQAASSLRQAAGEKRSVEDDIDKITAVLANAKSMGERRSLEQQNRERQVELLRLQGLLPQRQDELLAAGSPFSETFNYDMNYREALQGAVEPPPQESETEHGGSNDGAEVKPGPSPIDTGTAPPNPTPQETPTLEARTEVSAKQDASLPPLVVTGQASKPDKLQHAPAPDAIKETAPAADEDYTPQAGETCRPIWKLLAEGHFSLASQLVKSMSTQPDRPRMPPQLLLDTIALADALILPDGPLHDAITARLQDFSEEWFHEEGPRAWQDALSLLLVAATLRPMVLAPDSGASVIAGYLHLDTQGSYPALWSLVQSLRDTSERLRGFRIDMASLRSARNEAAIASDLQRLQQEAHDWLKHQAPAITIKYAPATKVWHRWLRPDGIIHRLVIPVVEHRVSAVAEVEQVLRLLTDDTSFSKLVRTTDRVENQRRMGDDIHAGALDHLTRCSEDAINLARLWLPFVQTPSHSNDRMRELLLHIRTELERQLPVTRDELNQADPGPWKLVASAQATVMQMLDGLSELFDPDSPLPGAEPGVNEVLSGELLDVPSVRIDPNWVAESEPGEVESAIRQWVDAPMDWRGAFEARLEVGDILGAARLLERHEAEVAELGLNERLRRETDSWRSKFRARLQDARREIEIGSAYGYLTDAVRGELEGELVRIEAQTEEPPRFDLAFESMGRIRSEIRTSHDEKAGRVKKAIEELKHSERNPADIQAVQGSLDEGDIATANELLQRVRQGLPAWPEETKAIDSLQSFLTRLPELEKWLLQRRSTDEIRTSIRNGDISGLDFRKVAGAQLDQAASMYGDWAHLKSRKTGDAGRLRSLLNGLGLVVGNAPTKSEGAQGKEIWTFQADTLSDREICPIPHFGSAAKGLYRLICLWERPTEDDIVQLVGDANLHRATFVFYFGRMTERKWRDLSLKTKRTRKSFALLDEVMLFFLAAQSGSRLAALFSASLPFAFSDPYDATAGFVPPEMFYGRAAELDAILGLNGRCFIYGGRQLGKTALMRRAEQAFHAPDRNRWAQYIDLRASGIGVNRAASEAWQVIAAGMKDLRVLSEAPSAADLARKGGIDALIDHIHAFLDKNDERRILLLLDEADRFFEQDGRHDYAETRRLKLLMDTTQRRFKVIFAGLHNVLRMTERANHPLAHFGQPIKIGPFIDEHEIREARELILSPLAASGFEFESRSLVVRILAQTNYYPSLIQLYCNHLHQHMLNKLGSPSRTAGPRYRIASQDIEAVYSSSDLRKEIRAKFNYTLQLDSRYEVIAYGMAYEALEGRYGFSEGMDWRLIWQNCALKWWSEGFKETSELDFCVLLDEMVELGVLSRPTTGLYGLRNPNIFLLLGNRDEIETVLIRNRQPSVEFDSAVFHPQLKMPGGDHIRHPLTFQQLSEILRTDNTVTAIAGTLASGIGDLEESLRNYIQQSGLGTFHLVDAVADHHAFGSRLKELLERRTKEGHTVIMVSSSAPWTSLWIREAKQMLDRLRSPSSFVAVCFIADPKTLWGAVSDDSFAELDIPWISLLPWRESFVRQYLEDLQLSSSIDAIRKASGFWPRLIYPLVDKCTQVLELERRANDSAEKLNTPDAAEKLLLLFGLNSRQAAPLLQTMGELGQATDPIDLAEFSETPIDVVKHVMDWGALLGIVKREGANYWQLDGIVEKILLARQEH